MALHQSSVAGVKWSVLWLGKRKLIVEKKFGNDFGGALALYTRLRDADKKYVTLHSDNVGFPPPLHITEHVVTRYRIVTRGGRRYKQKYEDVVNLMGEYNTRGIWWCPYCIQLRRFKLRKTLRGSEMYCPVCDITNYDFHCRRHNPKSIAVEIARKPRRTSARRVRRRT